jgi:DNA-binding transcriptional regulator YiaG
MLRNWEQHQSNPGSLPPLLPAIARDPKEMWQLLAEAAA